MKEIIADPSLVAKCGLYCGACPRYLKDKCPGCEKNEKATWCTVRTCNLENGYATCADCTLGGVEDCKKFNNFMAKLFGFVFRSNRAACITRISEVGASQFAEEMANQKRASLPR